LSESEAPSAEAASDALFTLNAVLANLSGRTSVQFAPVLESFTLTPGQAAYTMGTGGNFNTTRPISILSAYIRNETTDTPLAITNTGFFDTSAGVKSTSGIPDRLVVSGGNPLFSLTLYPVPSSAYSIFIRSEKPLSSVTLDAEVSFPPGWEMFLVYELARHLGPDYGLPLDPLLERRAAEMMESVMISAIKSRGPVDAPLVEGGVFDIVTGRR
jgi:hypothetical protein